MSSGHNLTQVSLKVETGLLILIDHVCSFDLEMLAKGQTAFNFNNISQSLYDLYLNRLGLGASTKHAAMGLGSAMASMHVDVDVSKRMLMVKKSKSSLLIPLLVPFRPSGGDEDASFYNTGVCVPEFRLVGSLELYKYHF